MESNYDDLSVLADTSELDEQILARAGEEDLPDRMKKEKDKKTQERAPWIRDIRVHWFSYLLLALSFILTEMTAFYLGTSPTLKTAPDGKQYIEFHMDAGHLLTTLVYMLVFPIVTEVAFGFFRKQFDKRETGNLPQQVAAAIGAGIALLSIVGTGVSGAFVIFSTLGSVGFLEVPPSVQTWLIWVIPSLIAIFGLLAWIYGSNSSEALSEKMAEEDDRKAELADRIRRREIERAGKRAIQAEAIRVYKEMVARGILSHREASDAFAQGLSIAELEKKLSRDLTGDGKIGETGGLNRPALPSPVPSPAPAVPPRAVYRTYTLDELLSAMGMSRDEAREFISKYRHLQRAESAFASLRDAGYLPADFGDDPGAVERFMYLFCELAGVAPTYSQIPPAAWGPGFFPSIPVAPVSKNGAGQKPF